MGAGSTGTWRHFGAPRWWCPGGDTGGDDPGDIGAGSDGGRHHDRGVHLAILGAIRDGVIIRKIEPGEPKDVLERQASHPSDLVERERPPAVPA